jgi:hypothetical protein
MVDDRVPGLVAVTPAQVEAARLLRRHRAARGVAVGAKVSAIADAPAEVSDERTARVEAARVEAATERADLARERAQFEAFRVETAAELAKHAMSTIADLDRVRQQMVEEHPGLAPQLEELQRQAVDNISETVRKGFGLGLG